MQTDAPPPQAITIPAEGEAYFAEHPLMLVDGKKSIVIAFAVSGSPADISQAREKLMSDGWTVKPTRRSDGSEGLSISAKGKTALETQRVSEKLRAGDYGQVKAIPFVMSPPNVMK